MMKDGIHIDIQQQRLVLWQRQTILLDCAISSAKNGVGESNGSGCTPRGELRIRVGIGVDAPINRVFVGRRDTGEIYSPTLAQQYPQRDWILSRILWLTGVELGKNKGGSVDTLRRYIYIHGCPDSCPMGIPESHGCIRMRNTDVINLFDWVTLGERVFIG